MYGKIFKRIYEGTLCGQWEAIVTFQQMIVFIDENNIFKMSTKALSKRTSIPEYVFKVGAIQILQTDKYSLLMGCDANDFECRYDGNIIFGNFFFKRKDEKRLPYKEWSILRNYVFNSDKFTCQYCGKFNCYLECDHIIPLSRNGTNHWSNLITSCFECNRSKGSKTLSEWLGKF